MDHARDGGRGAARDRGGIGAPHQPGRRRRGAAARARVGRDRRVAEPPSRRAAEPPSCHSLLLRSKLTSQYKREGCIVSIIVRAHDLALHSKRGAVYGPVNVVADDGLTVLHGPAGSGRTSLLLTLAGRMKPTSGVAEVLGHELPRRARPVQRATAIAGFQGIDTLEESVTVGAAIRERAAWLAPWWAIVRRTDDAELRRVLAPVFGHVPLPTADTLIWDLDEVQTVLLRIALAMMSEPKLLFFDQIEQLQAPAARLVLWQRLDAITRAGTAVVASAAAPDIELWNELGIAPLAFDISITAPEAPAIADPDDAIDLILEHA
ncbi:hypothetical protein DCE94_05285 [Agromyces badenianii]|nr:hypothetical protein DCE94_05285 [Agromyces badenianii]